MVLSFLVYQFEKSTAFVLSILGLIALTPQGKIKLLNPEKPAGTL
jgi:hypothetical protein